MTTTVQAYDLQQLKSAFKSQLMGVGMMAVMHIYFKYTNPLLVQSVIPLKGALEGNLAKIHVFGQSASGDLKRPWKAAGGMMAAFSGQGGANEIKTDRASIEAAEKAGRGGVKDEVRAFARRLCCSSLTRAVNCTHEPTIRLHRIFLIKFWSS